VVEVREIRKPRAGVVITGNEVFYGRIEDAFAPVIQRKIAEYGGEIGGIFYAPDDASSIAARLRELINAGCDLLITTGGMSVDPDDVTRFAIRNLGTHDFVYGSPVLPGSMVGIAYIEHSRPTISEGDTVQQKAGPELIPVLGIPACGIYSRTTVFDLLLPRILAGDRVTREEIAELGHGGLCLQCDECRYPLCPFGRC
jgi:molybdopterin biosynthesis enzyme